MRVSVIIPNYNHSTYFNDRIKSILSQTYNEYEIYILDDYSTDDSKNIIEFYRGCEKIKQIVYNSKNSSSTFRQWEKGFKLSESEFIWIAESDDIASPNFLERMISELTRNENISYVYCALDNIDENNTIIRHNTWAKELNKSKWENHFVNPGLTEIKDSFIYRNVIPNASSVVFRKQFLTHIYEVNSLNFKYAGDWLFWVKLSEKNLVCYIPEVLCFQRNHSFTTRSAKSDSIDLQKLKEYLYTIKYCSTVANKKLDWLNPNYDWIFLYFSKSINLTVKKIALIFIWTRSIKFVYKLVKTKNQQI